jgi:hypothetical protein
VRRVISPYVSQRAARGAPGAIDMLDTSHLKNFRPLIATPTHNHSVFVNYFMSVIDLLAAARDFGMHVDIHSIVGESLITRARNSAVATFLKNPQWTHLIWIDADIGFAPHAIFRLLLSDYDICAGIYPIKIELWPEGGPPAGMPLNHFINTYARYPVNTDDENAEEVYIEVLEDGFMKLREAPTGLMCVKRDVFYKMMEAYPHLKYKTDSIGVADEGLHYRFFDVSVDEKSNRYLSEDYTFCRLWENLGGSVYVDAISNLTHQGYKLYRGDYPATMRLNLGRSVGVPFGKLIHASGLNNLEKNMLQPLPVKAPESSS